MVYKVGRLMENLKDIHWERHLVHMVELIQDPTLPVQMGMDMSGLVTQEWESHWDQKLELREIPLMDYKEVRLQGNLKDLHWESGSDGGAEVGSSNGISGGEVM